MFADKGGRNKNDAEEHASKDMRRATSLLRLLKSSEESSLQDPELLEEFQRLHELLERIDRIARNIEEAPREPESPAHIGMGEHTTQQGSQQESPAAESDSTDTSAGSPSHTPAGEAEEPTALQNYRLDDPDDQLAYWWINFNGDVSLDRLSRLRTLLHDSPFTTDTRYDEITDGLIVLHVVTEQHISMDQLNWVLRLLMDLVGLDRKSAIVSKQ